jgi:hypothetical protein
MKPASISWKTASSCPHESCEDALGDGSELSAPCPGYLPKGTEHVMYIE